MLVFQLFPLLVELTFVLTVIGYFYPIEFEGIVLLSLVLYVTLTYIVTEWRAKFFKKQMLMDANYNQKATDSLLNFETVKYFNAEDHEELRFKEALAKYKVENVRVAKSLVTLNITQSVIICTGLGCNLLLAYNKILNGTLSVGDFVALNAYILSMYIPLSFLGTMWRFIRQSMVDVELIFGLLDVHEQTQNVTDQDEKVF
jgi:ATP-binding cassette subfamily B protein